jgi:hypothetical protein
MAKAKPITAIYITKLGEKNPIMYSIKDKMGSIKNAMQRKSPSYHSYYCKEMSPVCQLKTQTETAYTARE